eukprot:5708441-Pyramimonas_sp.AAC.1
MAARPFWGSSGAYLSRHRAVGGRFGAAFRRGQGNAHLQPPSGTPWAGEVCHCIPPSWAYRRRFWVGKVGVPSRWRAFTFSECTDRGV